jgi:predicted nucleotidyltransferase
MAGAIGMAGPVEMVQKVARALGPLIDEVVVVGGTVPSLLVTDPAAPPVRPTKDVDLVVNSQGRQDHATFEERLRNRGFQIQAPPACRYGIADVLVDIMTTTPVAGGFSDRWYAEAFATAAPARLPDGSTIRVIRSPLFLATKLNAWRDRGNGDYYAQDLEDILAVIDGRSVLLDEIRQSSPEVRTFLADSFGQLLAAQGFLDAVPGHLGGDPTAAKRADMALETMAKIVELGRFQ